MMALLHLFGVIAALAGAACFLVVGSIAWRDERVFGGILFFFAFTQLVSFAGHIGGIR